MNQSFNKIIIALPCLLAESHLPFFSNAIRAKNGFSFSSGSSRDLLNKILEPDFSSTRFKKNGNKGCLPFKYPEPENSMVKRPNCMDAITASLCE